MPRTAGKLCHGGRAMTRRQQASIGLRVVRRAARAGTAVVRLMASSACSVRRPLVNRAGDALASGGLRVMTAVPALSTALPDAFSRRLNPVTDRTEGSP